MVDAKQSVIETEREAKKALIKEKERLEKEIKQIKKSGSFISVSVSELSEQQTQRNLSQKNDESMSLYFARSKGSPRMSMIEKRIKGKYLNKVHTSQLVRDQGKVAQLNKRINQVGSCSVESQENSNSMMQIDEFENNNSGVINIVDHNNFGASPERFTNHKPRSSISVQQIQESNRNQASMASDPFKFSESEIPIAESDSIIPNPAEFMRVLVGCDSDENDELE